jgi:hypothetical protein
MGVEADNEPLRASLSVAVGLPVAAVDPFSAFSCPAPSGPDGETFAKLTAGTWSLATGLALKKLPGKGQLFDVPPGQTHEVARA